MKEIIKVSCFCFLTLCYFPVTLFAQKQKPNVIFFLVDDMGWQDTSVPFWDSTTNANKKFHTPNMERLARQSVKFTNAYANSICTPSRVSLMSGINSAAHRVTNWVSEKDIQVDPKDELLQTPNWNVNGLSPFAGQSKSVYATALPQLLTDNGYYTIHCGKAHFGATQTTGANPLNLGFQKNIGGGAAGNPASYFAKDSFGYRPNHYNVKADLPNLKKYWGTSTFLTEDLTTEAMLAMDTAQIQKKPFFLYMSHYAVHLPFDADSRFVKPYLDKGYSPSEASYCALIEGMDHSLGKLMDYLEQKDLAKNTIIIFMSDNGGFSHSPRVGKPNTQNYPLRGGKGSLYEGGIREPMMVFWNGFSKPGTTSKQNVIIEDFYPTILQMAGVKNYTTVQKLDGKSIVPFITNPKRMDKKRPLIWNFPNNWGGGNSSRDNSFMVAIRQGDWKLIYFEKYGTLELYNLNKDIKEEHNTSKQFPNKTKALARLLTRKLKNRQAQMPTFKADGKQVPWPDEIRFR
ncbi:sulfatase [Pedobacter arcticus]|uniref:sulfatase n=1 Tax=Pedobacter arcticus TaxID=752140 RepID=UPI0002D99A69|nr:sulfatase [Pedobacter arcticus]